MDYLPNTTYQLEQPSEMYHFNSDTVLLGSFMRIRHKDTVLDVGCSTGALMLYASLYKPACIDGIDLYDEVLNQAKTNLMLNNVSANVYLSRMQDLEGKYDVLLCNPPYFTTKNDDLKNDSCILRSARHEDSLSLPELMENAYRLLKDQGKFFLVHRASRMEEILVLANRNKLHVSRMRIAYDHRNGISKSVVMELRKGKCPELRIESPCYMDDKTTFFNNNA